MSQEQDNSHNPTSTPNGNTDWNLEPLEEQLQKNLEDRAASHNVKVTGENEDHPLWSLSQSELITQLIESQSKVNYLEGLCHNLVESTVFEEDTSNSPIKLLGTDDGSNEMQKVHNLISGYIFVKQPIVDQFSPLASPPSELQPQTINDGKSLQCHNQLHQESESLPLIPSPYVTTPPYEYIVLTEDNEKKFRIFVNPKIDKAFRKQLKKLKSKETDATESGNESGIDEEDSCLGLADNLSLKKSGHILPLPHAASDTTIIHCFDPSDVDVELKRIFKANPPVTHKVVRRKSRLERRSSVPAIDSYYGTQDLDKVGHASYFIPDLSPSERKAIGWKNQYTYGRWKYSTSKAASHSLSGHSSFFSRSNLFNMVRKSKSGHKERSNIQITTTAATAVKRNEESEKDDPHYMKRLLQQEKNANAIKSIVSAESTKSTFGSSLSQCPSVRLNKNRRFLQFLSKCLAPCYKSKKGTETSSCCSSQVLCTAAALPKVTAPADPKTIQNKPQIHTNVNPYHQHHHHHHNHHKMILGCFHFKQKLENAVGGDIVLSADDSIVSMLYEYSRRNDAALIAQGQTLDTKQLQNSLQTTNKQSISPESDQNVVTESVSSAEKLVQQMNPYSAETNQSRKRRLKATKTMHYNVISNSCDKHQDNDTASENTNSYSAIESVQSPPSMQVSANSFYTTPHDLGDLNLSEPDYEDNETEEADYGKYAVQSGWEKGRLQENDDVFEIIPETRFLDPKDLDLSKYSYNKPLIDFVDDETCNEYYEEEEYENDEEYVAQDFEYYNSYDNNNEEDCDCNGELSSISNAKKSKNTLHGQQSSKKAVITGKDDCKVS